MYFKVGFHYPSSRAENSGAFFTPINSGRQLGPSTRAVNSGSGNRPLVYSLFVMCPSWQYKSSSVVLMTERRVSLGSQCTIDDVCDDTSASCVNGVCECRLTHYNSRGQCGNYPANATVGGVAQWWNAGP